MPVALPSSATDRALRWRATCRYGVPVDWIGAILDSIREMECPCCGARLATCAVRGVTAEPNALVVRLLCAVCGENSLAVVKRDQASETPISRDDVLDAHEFLQRWDGTVTEVLAPGTAYEKRQTT